ncbi:CubicO group peptidase (beta-lactamase class C family) [Nocardioides cavernae]|uniref:CubicO group peptidase (Beta-lactamase class C family) n=1 Tax=Nocardioides cavernae TaxID=1921566 RepID=A0A7Y9H0E9_9ACTN|nr:serine hydrolase domain-containing protein [Nocardioides cavernae]NYE35627.1 CubicO group peptidase (beta-lactamase class C family) [Nocardioides cavernae]
MTGLEAGLRPFVDTGQVPGLVALVARGDDVEVVALGTQDSSGRPMARDSIFRAASITKPVTAAVVMSLVEDRLVDLDAPVGDLLPELAEPRVLRTRESQLDDTVACERPVTARHLLSGTAGHGFCTWDSPVPALLTERLGQADEDVQAVPEPDEWMRRLGEIPLMHQPGEGWTYNAAYDALGVLASRAAGRPYADVVADRVLRPLGMDDTGFHVPADRVDRFTTLYQAGDGGLRVSDEPNGYYVRTPAFASGSGGLVTTVDDWLAFGRMLLAGGGNVLSPESVRQMTTDHITEAQRELGGWFLDGQGWGYGGGVDTALIEPWNEIGRYGWVGGTGTSAYVHPATGTVAVLLTQVVLGAPGIEDLLKAFWTLSTT